MFETLIEVIITVVFETSIDIVSSITKKRKAEKFRQEELYALMGSLTQREQIELLLKNGRKIEAIKLFRQDTGTTLKKAKYAVEFMQEELQLSDFNQRHNNADEDAELRQYIQSGKKINAIKRYRELAGVGLKEAKLAVELLEKRDNQPAIHQISAPDTDDAELWSYIKSGDKIRAIKRYRQLYGTGLKEAKNAIDSLTDNTTYTTTSTEASTGYVDPDELQRLIQAGRKIEAIKYYRECTGVSLKEARDAVEWLATRGETVRDQ